MIDAVALLGPTASGKSAAGLALAGAFEIEIVSVDSALVYRGMDIGTAKPARDELARVPHHLIDIREPSQPYSAAEFAHDAHTLCAQIRVRGRLPVLIGGTMLYYKAFASGLDDLPRADARVRAALDAEARTIGWPAMHARLARIDPPTAARLAPNDAQRIQRALEVFEASGRPMSALLGARAPQRAIDLFTMSLEPSDRAWLHACIEARFDAMLNAGFLDEVRALRRRGDLHADLPSMRAVGYRQAWRWFEGEYGADAAARETMRLRGIAATRQLAKRQLTWLRSMTIDERIDACTPDAAQRCVDALRRCVDARCA